MALSFQRSIDLKTRFQQVYLNHESHGDQTTDPMDVPPSQRAVSVSLVMVRHVGIIGITSHQSTAKYIAATLNRRVGERARPEEPNPQIAFRPGSSNGLNGLICSRDICTYAVWTFASNVKMRLWTPALLNPCLPQRRSREG